MSAGRAGDGWSSPAQLGPAWSSLPSGRTLRCDFFFSSRRRHTRYWRDWSSDVCSSDLQSERDYQLASGLSQGVETADNVFRQTTARLPWLLIGMIGGIGNSMILGNFDATFAAHPEMALYIPLIGGTGGNVGTQSSAIIVQGLANSSLDAKNTVKQIGKESVVALINATIISLLVYTYNFIRFGATATVTYSVSISLFAVVMFASIFGTLVPMTLEKFKVDPAIATGPFIAITNDIIGMMMYMGITVLLS